jgi:hypothetical protein
MKQLSRERFNGAHVDVRRNGDISVHLCDIGAIPAKGQLAHRDFMRLNLSS